MNSFIEQKAHREMTAQISRLEDEAERLEAAGKMTPERAQSIRLRMDLAIEEYEAATPVEVSIPVQLQESVEA